jgi:hypothetical protein
MKAYIGPVNHWFQPYRWLKYSIEWWYGYGLKCDYDKIDTKKLDALEEWISKTFSWVRDIENWFDNRYERAVLVRIDKCDTWNVDSTLAFIILPLLKQLRNTKHGSPYVDDADVPENLRSIADTDISDDDRKNGIVDKYLHARWEWVFDEIIWAFEQVNDPEADDKFYYDIDPAKSRFEKGLSIDEMLARGGFDRDGYMAWQERKSRGFALFGKYYEALWD